MTPHEEFAKAYGRLAEAKRKVEGAANALYVAKEHEIACQHAVDEAWMKFNERVCSDE